jgi:hypothetical protein
MPMTKKNKAEISDYRKWLEDIKKRIRAVQLKASVRLNSELIRFYWELGEEIVNKQALSKWGLVSTRFCGHIVKHISPRTLQGLSFLSKSAS